MLHLLKKNKDLATLGLTLIADRLIGFLLLFLLVRTVTDEFFSFWTQVNALPGMLCGILGLGLGRGVLRLFIDNNLPITLISKMLNSIVIIFLCITTLTYILIFLLGTQDIFEFLGGKSSTQKGILALFLFIVIEGLFEIYLNYLRSKLSPEYLKYLMYRILPKFFFGISVLLINNDFWFAIFLYISLSFIILGFLKYEVKRCAKAYQINVEHKNHEYNELLIKLLKYSIPVMASAIAFPLLNLMVRGEVYSKYGYENIGIFSIYMSFVGIIVYFPESFQNYIFPKLAISADNILSNNKDIYNQFYYYLFFSLIISCSFYLVGPFLLKFLYPKYIWTYNDSLIIAFTAFCWISYFSLQRYFLIFHPLKNYLITLTSFVSLFIIVCFKNLSIFNGLSSSVFLIALFFIICSLFISIALKYLSFKSIKN